MRKRDYDTMYNESTGGTDTHVAVDTQMNQTSLNETQPSMVEGFAAASGIRPETAESGGRIRYPESKDKAIPDPLSPSIERENPELADVDSSVNG